MISALARPRVISTFAAAGRVASLVFQHRLLFRPLHSSTTTPTPTPIPNGYTFNRSVPSLADLTLPSHPPGTQVTLCGWAQTVRRLSASLAFVVLRDGTATVQCVVHSEKLVAALADVSAESVVRVTGSTLEKKEGGVEVVVEEVELVNRADKLPVQLFGTGGATLPNEDARLKYRYLDLRRPSLQLALRARHLALQSTRTTLTQHHGFLEIETPMLFKSTPEGAREFLVPTRRAGTFYALAQSPQQYKQLLMASGIDRYFQIARCFRDEDQRKDRQPEFTQVDLEVAWPEGGPEAVRGVVEDVVAGIVKAVSGATADERPPVRVEFPRISYEDAMRRFGIDKPDMRYDGVAEIAQLPAASASTDYKVVDTLHLPAHTFPLSAADTARLTAAAKSVDPSLHVVRWRPDRSPAFPFLDPKSTVSFDGYTKNDTVIFAPRTHARAMGGATALGKLRAAMLGCGAHADAPLLPASARASLMNRPKRHTFVWVEGFPLFTPTEMDDKPAHAIGTDNNNNNNQASAPRRQWTATHHPFTAPRPSDAHLLVPKEDRNDEDALASIHGLHYDLVLNGFEVAGGSVRIHSADMQRRVFEVLGMSETQRTQFAHLVDALRFGCPPHAGAAIGFDRLLSVLLETPSIRDVIAFPKSSGAELMVGSPAHVAESQLKEYHLRVRDE
ncbi:tRNA synthetases class II-domain-containing protein [Blastocladiella britannica]|nr:tRNA synthetases class II-domain-containing protein [Blastocladiella britannica]